jgi:CheY-like chemotaxis protein
MDISMPGMDGREATRRIRAECGDAHRPWIIALSAGALQEEREAALAAGMNDFITKPVSGAMLAAALGRMPAA